MTGQTSDDPTGDAGAAAVYPMPRGGRCPFDPAAGLREREPISKVRLWNDSVPWLLTGYADQQALSTDARVAVAPRHPGFPLLSAGFTAAQQEADRQAAELGEPTLTFGADGPEHSRLRRMMSVAFTVKRVEALRPAIQRIVDDLIDRMLAGSPPCDLVAAFALPVPSLVICEMLGVPYADHEFFQRHSAVILNHDSTAQDAGRAMGELVAYLEAIVDRKLTEPGEDVLSDMAARIHAGEMTRRQAARMGTTLLQAGHETTANMIALGTLALLENPGQMAALRETGDPAAVSRAVEELLRYLTIAQGGRRRVALEDVEVGGVTIRAGDGVILASDAANRDPAMFTDPDRLDLGRDARRHMAFGYGPHQCLGQQLARVELQVVYGTLYRRIPALRLAVPVDRIRFKTEGFAYGVHELPVAW
ncbi:cytochrome P450 [Actinoplanes sp. NPDC051851]|uniref:cytochrome P450 n=1 Tax=Actinoplanes sp. NPDC051851 TaxID=3154753 RepID=UPI0034176A89